MKTKQSLLLASCIFALSGFARLFMPFAAERPVELTGMIFPAWFVLFAVAVLLLVLLLLLDAGPGQSALLSRLSEIVTALSPFIPKRPPPSPPPLPQEPACPEKKQ